MLGLDELERSGCAHCTQAELRLGDAVCRDPGQDKDRNPADPASPPAHRVMAAPALRAPAQSGKHTVGLREEEDQSDSYCPIPGPSGYAGLGLLWQGEPERSGRARRTQVDVRLCEAAGRDLGQENKDRGRRVRVPVHAQSWRLQLSSQHRVRLCPDVWTLFLIHQVFSAVDITSHRVDEAVLWIHHSWLKRAAAQDAWTSHPDPSQPTKLSLRRVADRDQTQTSLTSDTTNQ
ncbi:uncharacterized protein LOC105731396 isoform X6 [Aotus nancymaae]|uniref:uncharacterized protein LOC105731396 isoform X6 n=1 Tax=Aotus nancymaae TaxID=37293 RepID=UPI00062608D9|nr:uncharacterized protein LOC105731396 isoform X4 [Aotus nancymaae]